MIADIERYTHIFNRQIRHALKEQLEPLGLNETNFFYLPLIVQYPGINQAYFITAIMREQSIVTKQINKLVKEGWVKKKISTKDRRQSELYPTKKTLETLPQINQITANISAKAVEALTPAEQAQFADLLEKATKGYAKIILNP